MMPNLAIRSGLSLRTVEEKDVPLIARWRSDPAVIMFYSGRDRPLDEAGVRRQYLARSANDAPEEVREYQACLVEKDGRPVAFVQFYRPRPDELSPFHYPPEEVIFGIDLLIGDPGLWGKGLGSRIIEMTCDYLREKKSARRVIADPRVDNHRSVKAFERAGFRKVTRLDAHEVFEGISQDCWWMEYP